MEKAFIILLIIVLCSVSFMSDEIKRIKKSTTDAKLFGVCGGIAEYLNINSNLVRIGFVILTLAFGIGIAVYIAFAIVM